MRIRKKFQGVIPEHKILDTISSSQTDTYSCRKINELVANAGGGGGGTGGSGGSGASIDQIYPVGSIYISASSTVNPNEVFLGTSWERFATGRTLVGVDETQDEFATVGKEGGEKTHLLTAAESGLQAHNHTQAAHSHLIGRDKDGGSGSNRYTVHGAGASGADATSPTNNATPAINNCAAKDATDAHNNLQPYITVFMWQRVA